MNRFLQSSHHTQHQPGYRVSPWTRIDTNSHQNLPVFAARSHVRQEAKHFDAYAHAGKIEDCIIICPRSFVLISSGTQYLNEVLARRTRPPLDLWCFYVSYARIVANIRDRAHSQPWISLVGLLGPSRKRRAGSVGFLARCASTQGSLSSLLQGESVPYNTHRMIEDLK